jgi:transcriptional regulator with XRE-family HTH domain
VRQPLCHPPHRSVAFAKRLQAIMADREMTQSEVAAAIWGRSRNAKGALVANSRDRLSVWISGKNFPDPENLAALAKALKVKVSDLAPDAELSAPRTKPAWSFSGDGDMVFVQIAQYVPEAIAHEIYGLLLKAKQKMQPPGGAVQTKAKTYAGSQ